MSNGLYSSLVEQLCERVARATISQLRLRNLPLRQHLLHALQSGPGNLGSFLAAPVFESLFEYERAEHSLAELVELGLLDERLVEQLDAPPERHEAKRFRQDIKPFTHQLKAWENLIDGEPRSAVISTGTASGKTECFLIPVLNDLVRELPQQAGELQGVRALFLYPLNALINSQKERLAAWTAGFQGRIRFCLYNGATPKSVRNNQQLATPEEVLSRKELRRNAPPILVTNSTMLEFMLVRQEDRPIIDQSRGKLRWVVLDEAHTYLGSNAAEISLLLRRVMHAFQVDPRQVRFVATSATIGNSAADQDRLREYLSQLAGVPLEQVVAIGGRRVVPPLDFTDQPNHELPASPGELQGSYQDRRRRLAAVPAIRELRTWLTEKPRRLDEIQSKIAAGEATHTLQVLDAISEQPPSDAGEQALLPLRGNLFVRTQPGLWACWNPHCSGRQSTNLNDAEWRFGAVFFSERTKCSYCDSLVFEILHCRDCGDVYLGASEEDAGKLVPIAWSESDKIDIFAEAEEEEEAAHQQVGPSRQLIASRALEAGVNEGSEYNPNTGVPDWNQPGLIPHRLVSLAEGHKARCEGCGTPSQQIEKQFRSLQVGPPFYLGVAVPALLEKTPSNTEANAPFRPHDGRQLITFTDSRQRTARFTLNIALQAERNFVRSFVYHILWSGVGAANKMVRQQIETLTNEVSILRGVAHAPGIAGIIAEKEKELASLATQASAPNVSLPWEEMCDKLAGTREVERLAKEYGARALELSDRSRCAQFLLLREFARRSKSQYSLETLGLVQVNFAQLRLATKPSDWPGTQGDWRDFLKLSVDFFLRANAIVEMPRSFPKWFGTTWRIRGVIPPDIQPSNRWQDKWPTLSDHQRPERLAKLLCFAFGKDLNDPDHRCQIDGWLRKSWDALLNAGVLKNCGTEGYRLEFKTSELCAIHQAWQCPVTERLLDTTLRGISPYQLEHERMRNRIAQPIEMPALRYPFNKDEQQGGQTLSAEAIRAWLRDDEKIRLLRSAGAWTEFSDRIAGFAHYFSAAEHAAQLSKEELQLAEKEFREFQINVLSCSTTMEMGIDIGGLTAVAMNNAPPGPANWLQRAGRAGRRDISQSFTLTLCQNQPHGEAVFANPRWPFDTPVSVPRVSLNSQRIVQRHVNSSALTSFLAVGVPNQLKLRCKEFFLSSTNQASAPCDQFIAWLQAGEYPEDLVNGVRMLVRGTGLQGRSEVQLFDACVRQMEKCLDEWRGEHSSLKEQSIAAGGEDEDTDEERPIRRALSFQLKRLEKEFLLKTLADGGFLPSYGFPLHLLPFVNTCAADFARQAARDHDGEREDNRQKRNSYPTRHLAMAIREYAPGSSVTIGKRIYRSAGVTLNWQIPAQDEQDFREPQQIRWAIHCNGCGFWKTQTSMPEELCPVESCGERVHRFQYLEPAGFAVDVREEPSNNLEDQNYVPPTQPKVVCEGAWVALPNPSVGRFRHDPVGSVFHYSTGHSEFGYAVCLACGRAESESDWANLPAGDLPQSLKDHNRLRSGRKADGTALCPGNEHGFQIKRNLFLGGEFKTDVFELQLRSPIANAAPLSREAAVPLAIAFRLALARQLGIETEELGWAVDHIPGDQNHHSIKLFDTASGGAGYVGQAHFEICEVLRQTRKLLECPQGCESACHACLLDFDTQHERDLNRHQALNWLTNELLDSLRLPEQFCIYGDATESEPRSIVEALLLRARTHLPLRVTVAIGGNAGSWSLDDWPIWPHLVRIADDQIPVELFVAQETWSAIPWTIKCELVSRASSLKTMSVRLGAFAPVGKSSSTAAKPLLRVEDSAGGKVWASFAAAPSAPGEDWGNRGETPIVTGPANCVANPMGILVTLEEVLQQRPNACQVMYVQNHQLNAPVQNFGEQFWNLITDDAPWLTQLLKEPLKSLSYSDRYLKSPLTARLLYEVVRRLVGMSGIPKSTMIVAERISGSSSGREECLFYDWAGPHQQQSVLQAIFEPYRAQVALKEKINMPHDRFLLLEWPQGRKVRLTLDQGLGFINAARPTPQVDYSETNPDELATQILTAQFRVAPQRGPPVRLYVENIG